MIGWVVVWLREDRDFAPRVERERLFADRKSAQRRPAVRLTERGSLELSFHAAAPAGKDGERSWSWAAVSLSITTMGPPHLGQSRSGRQGRVLVRSAMAGLRRVVESKVAAQWRAGGWRGSQSGEYGRSLWAAGATRSGAGTHRAIGSSISVDCYEQSHASER